MIDAFEIGQRGKQQGTERRTRHRVPDKQGGPSCFSDRVGARVCF